jgi:hypothetical protein
MEKRSLKQMYLEQLTAGLPAILSEIASSGACKPEYWGITNQDVVYSLALAHEISHPTNPFFGRADVLEAAGLAGDYLRSLQDDTGQVEFVKVGGSTWGQIYPPFTIYHWLEAYRLLQDKFSPERKKRWAEGLLLALSGMDREIRAVSADQISDQQQYEKNWIFKKPFQVNNISTWNGMSLFRAGEVFRRDDWKETGRTMVREAAKAMNPGGFWPEFGGPTTYYNLVLLHAIGLYYGFSKDPSVLPALEKAVEFQIHFTYPDGRVVETIDGRVRYDDRVQERGHPAFAHFPQGRGYLRFLQEQMKVDALSPEPPAPIYTVFDLPFFQRKTDIPSSASPLLHIALQTIEGQESAEEVQPPQSRADYLYTLGDQALVRKQGDWFYCLSGITLEGRESKWAMDRQNHVSLWHRRAGLIVGGGNSQDQPEWSSFVVGSKHTASSGRVELRPKGDRVLLSFPDATGLMEVTLVSQTEAILNLHILGEADRHQARSNIVLKLHPWKQITTALGERFFFTDQPITLHSCRTGPWVEHCGWRMCMPQGSVLTWPVFPTNPYNPDNSSPFGSSRGILTVSHSGGSPVRVTFSIGEAKGE